MAKIAPNTSSAKPAAKPAEKKGGGSKRPTFDKVGSKDTAVFPFKVIETGEGDAKTMVATPEGYKHSEMKRLKKDDFEKASGFKLYQAEEHEFVASKLRDEANTLRASGDGKGGGKATRLIKMMSKADEIMEELKAQGIDVEALLAATKAKKAAEAAAAKPA
jgi:hypothetical protein